MRFPAGLRALNHRDYRLFWAGQLVSLVGTWMQSVGQSWLVLTLTNSPFKLGLIGALQWGPMLCLSFLAGAVADRVPKRRLILAAQTALMLQAFVLAGLTWAGHVQYWHVAILALLYGLAATVDMPARQSFIVEMVGKDDLLNAIALNSMVFNGARVVGPAVAGLLVDRYGIPIAFLLNGLSFIGVLIALWAMEAEGLPTPRASGTVREEIATGLRYAIGTPHVSLILGLLLAVSLFLINHNVLVPLLARDVLQEGAHGFGLLMSALGAGAVAGAIGMAMVGQARPPRSLLFTSAASLGLTIFLLAFVRVFWLAAAGLALVGLAQIIFMTSCNTILQVTVPNELRGRVMSLYAFVFAGVTPIGALFVGAVAETWGISATFAAAGAIGLFSLAGLFLWASRRPGGRE
jgi:MFS family permease